MDTITLEPGTDSVRASSRAPAISKADQLRDLRLNASIKVSTLHAVAKYGQTHQDADEGKGGVS